RDVAQRMHHLVDAAGVEQRLVEAVAVAVVAEVEPEDVPAFGEQPTAGLQYISGIDAAFPTVEQHGESARFRRDALRGVGPGEAHAAAAIDHHRLGALQHGLCRAWQQQAPDATRGQHGLHVSTAQQPRRQEVLSARQIHAARSASAAAMRSRDCSAMRRRPSEPAVTGARKCTSASIGGSPSRRRKLPTKLSSSRKPASTIRLPPRAKRNATGCTGTSASSAAWKMRAWNTLSTPL